LKRPKRKDSRERRPLSARADREKYFFTQRILELLEVERRLAFVAKHFEHGRAAFVRNFHAAILEVHHVHLEGFDLKVPVVAAIWTSQRHLDSLTHLGAAKQDQTPDSMKWSERTQRESAADRRFVAKSGQI
jgi:hypothetical protein